MTHPNRPYFTRIFPQSVETYQSVNLPRFLWQIGPNAFWFEKVQIVYRVTKGKVHVVSAMDAAGDDVDLEDLDLELLLELSEADEG